MRVYRRRQNWCADFRDEGFGQHVTLGPANLTEWQAGVVAARKLAELETAAADVPATRGQLKLRMELTVSKLIDMFLAGYFFQKDVTHRYYETHLKVVRRDLGEMKLADLAGASGTLALDKWTKAMHDAGRKGHTVLGRHSVLRVMLAWAFAREYIVGAKPEFPRPGRRNERLYTPRETWISEADVWRLANEVERIVAAGKRGNRRHREYAYRRRLFVLAGFYLGQRPQDLGTFSTQHVSLEFQSWVRRSHKTDEHGDHDVVLDLPPPIAEAIAAERDRRGGFKPGELIFGRWPRTRIVITRACENLGLPHLELGKDMRRSCATHLAMKGWREEEVAHWLGHTSSAMVREVYRKIPRAALTAKMDRTWAGSAAKPMSAGAVVIELGAPKKG